MNIYKQQVELILQSINLGFMKLKPSLTRHSTMWPYAQVDGALRCRRGSGPCSLRPFFPKAETTTLFFPRLDGWLVAEMNHLRIPALRERGRERETETE